MSYGPIPVRCIVILSSHLSLPLTRISALPVSPPNLYAFILSTVPVPRPVRLILLDLITLIISGKGTRVTKLLIRKFSPFPCRFPFKVKVFPAAPSSATTSFFVLSLILNIHRSRKCFEQNVEKNQVHILWPKHFYLCSRVFLKISIPLFPLSAVDAEGSFQLRYRL
jgi:hypothetical protein